MLATSKAPYLAIVMLLNNPADLSTWRQRLFSLDNEVKLFPGEFEEIWPHVTNFWSRQIVSKPTRDNLTRYLPTTTVCFASSR